MSTASYFGCKSLCNDEGERIQSGCTEETISISGLIAVPIFFTFLYLDGIVDTVDEQTPASSILSLSHISAVAGDVAIMRGFLPSFSTFSLAASTAAFVDALSFSTVSFVCIFSLSGCWFTQPQIEKEIVIQSINARILFFIIFHLLSPSSPVAPEIINNTCTCCHKNKT